MLLLLAIVLFIFIILYHIIDYGYHKYDRLYYVGKREELQKTWYYKAYKLKDVRSTLEILTACTIIGMGLILLVAMLFWSPHID